MAKRNAKTVDLDEKYTGAEPSWEDTEKLSAQELESRMRRAFLYYNYYFSVKDMRKDVVRWLSRQPKVSKSLITAYMQSADHMTSVTACSLVRCIARGMPTTERHVQYLMKVIQNAAATVSVIEDQAEEKPSARRPSVQDHMRAQADAHIVHFEELEADLRLAKSSIAPNALAYLREKEVPQPLIGKIRTVFEQKRDEIAEAQAGKDEQLREGYRLFRARDFKRFLEFYDSLLADLDAYGKVKRAARKPRIKKPQDRARVVKKLNYLKNCTELKVTSIQPQDIIGAQTLWIYNTKNRKLGRYVAEAHNSLGVRGSTILGFDPAQSVSKTLRKPEKQIAELLKAGKVALRKFLDDIRAVEVSLNGRINKHMLLLRVS